MVTEEFKTIILKADNGNYLTNANDVNIEDRIIATSIALGKYDSIENYKEISAEEADKYKQELEKAKEIKA